MTKTLRFDIGRYWLEINTRRNTVEKHGGKRDVVGLRVIVGRDST